MISLLMDSIDIVDTVDAADEFPDERQFLPEPLLSHAQAASVASTMRKALNGCKHKNVP